MTLSAKTWFEVHQGLRQGTAGGGEVQLAVDGGAAVRHRASGDRDQRIRPGGHPHGTLEEPEQPARGGLKAAFAQ